MTPKQNVMAGRKSRPPMNTCVEVTVLGTVNAERFSCG